MTKQQELSKLKQAISDTIKDIRTHYGTQQEFADLFNIFRPIELQITRSDVAKYETGHNVPPTDKYLKIVNMRPSNI